MTSDEMMSVFSSMKSMREDYIGDNPFVTLKNPLDGEKLSPKATEYIERLAYQVNSFNQALKKKVAQMNHLEKEYRNLKVANASLQSKVDELKDIIDSTETT